MAEKEGLLIQDSKGNVYFLRPEIMEATRVKPGDVPDLEKKIADAKSKTGDVSGYALSGSTSLSSVNLLGSVKTTSYTKLATGSSLAKIDLGSVASTVMCPW